MRLADRMIISSMISLSQHFFIEKLGLVCYFSFFLRCLIGLNYPSMVSIILLEDELILAEDLKQKLESLNYNVIGIATSGEEAIALVNKKMPDLALLDINVRGEMDGLEVGSYFKKAFGLPIIYLTQFTDLQTFERAKMVSPNSYLTKPVNIWDLVRAIELSIASASVANLAGDHGYLLPKAFYLRNSEQSFEKVPVESILFLKASGSYTEIFTTEKKFMFSDNLSYFAKKLLVPGLIRVHRSWIINVDKVDRIEETNLVINDHKIPVGKTYKNVLKRYFTLI